MPLALNLLNPTALATAGVFVVAAALFAETGLLIGIFLPGDSLLFTAGFLAYTGKLPLAALLVVAPIAAILGAQTGWWIGKRAGPALFSRPNSRLFKQEYVERTREYVERYGTGKAVVLARFIPIVRTLIYPLTGMIGMTARRFLAWNVVGAVFWTIGVSMAGYGLGAALGDRAKNFSIDHYILPLVAAIIVISFVPIFLESRRERRRRAAVRDSAASSD